MRSTGNGGAGRGGRGADRCERPPCRCWTSHGNMGFWWILRFPVFLATLVRRWRACGSSGSGAVGLASAPLPVGLWRPAAKKADSILPGRTGREARHSARTLAGALAWGWAARLGRVPSSPRAALSHALRMQINSFIFIRILHILVAKLRAHQMHHTDYKFRWVRAGGRRGGAGRPVPVLRPRPHRLAKSTLTLIPLLGVHEVVFAFVTDEQAQGTLRFVKFFFDLFLSSFQVRAPQLPAPPPRGRADTPLSAGPAGGCPLLFPQQGGR